MFNSALTLSLDCLGHAHVLLAAFERVSTQYIVKKFLTLKYNYTHYNIFFLSFHQHVDGSFSVKPLKQKQIVS